MSSFQVTVKAVLVPKRLDAYLVEALESKYSRGEIKTSLERGLVRLNGREVLKPSTAVKEGDRIEGEIRDVRSSPVVGENIPLRIVYEDDAILVVDKPCGMVVHPGAGNKKGTLVHALLGRGGALSSVGGHERPGIVHRLDKDTSGLVLVAKNNQAHRALQAQFQSRSLSKTYIALVKSAVDFEEGRVTASIGRDPKDRRRMAVSRSAEAKEADTRYRVLKRFRYFTLLELKILTGRTHQIRVHLAHLGHPVAGDEWYGTKKPGERLALHASKIEFVHPVTEKKIKFESAIPKEMQAMIEKAEETNKPI